MYPGAPAENFNPELVIDSTTYRNLALLRPAYHSSSYDYNLTAQLVTDGLKDTTLPTWISTSASGHRDILKRPSARRCSTISTTRRSISAEITRPLRFGSEAARKCQPSIEFGCSW